MLNKSFSKLYLITVFEQMYFPSVFPCNSIQATYFHLDDSQEYYNQSASALAVLQSIDHFDIFTCHSTTQSQKCVKQTRPLTTNQINELGQNNGGGHKCLKITCWQRKKNANAKSLTNSCSLVRLRERKTLSQVQRTKNAWLSLGKDSDFG